MPWSAERRPTALSIHMANATEGKLPPSRMRTAAEYLATVAALMVIWLLGVAYFLGGPQEFLRAIW